LGGQGFLSTEVAFALRCCGCGSYPACLTKKDCHCPAFAYHCPWCAAPNSDLETVKLNSPSQDPSGVINIRGISAPVLSSAGESMIIDIRGSSGQKNLMRKLVELESMKYARKFSCPQAEHTNLESERLGLQAKVDLGN
jgi:hypothetical protein